MARDRARRCCDRRPSPLFDDQAKGRDEADAQRRYADLVSDALHLEANEVVRDEQSPHLLCDRVGALAADRLEPLQHVGLDLPIAELELPALVVEVADLGGRKSLGVDERRQQGLRLEALALVADGPSEERRGKRGILLARLPADRELDEIITCAELLDDLPLARGLGSRQPVPIGSAGG